jgi:hypothetical protein
MYNVIPPRSVPPPYLYQGSNGNNALVTYNGGSGKIIIEDQGGPGTARGYVSLFNRSMEGLTPQ